MRALPALAFIAIITPTSARGQSSTAGRDVVPSVPTTFNTEGYFFVGNLAYDDGSLMDAYVDTTRIRFSSDTAAYWEMMVWNKPRQTRGTVRFNGAIDVVQVVCPQPALSRFRSPMFYLNATLVTKSPDDRWSAWADIVPNSVGDKGAGLVCAYGRLHGLLGR